MKKKKAHQSKKQTVKKNEDQCRSCFKWFNKDDLYYGPDPYQMEIHEALEETVLCESCYENNLDDI